MKTRPTQMDADAYRKLCAESERLCAELDATTGPRRRAALFRSIAAVERRRAEDWDRHPNARLGREVAADCRWSADMAEAMAEIEDFRAEEARRGRDLPVSTAVLPREDCLDLDPKKAMSLYKARTR